MSVTSNVSLKNVSAATEKNIPFIPWDNPDNIISAATAAIMHTVFICGATEVMMILGIPGNIINLVVFTRQGLKDRVTFMLFCLALVDLLNLLCYFSINVSCFIQPVDPVLARNVKTLQYPQVLYVNLIAGFLSMALVTVLSVDRCLAITLPMKAARILTYKRSVATTSIVSAIIVGINAPALRLNTVVWITDPVSNRPLAQLVPSEFAVQHPLYSIILDSINPIMKMVCFISVLISCSITVKTITAAGKLRAEMSDVKFHQSEIQITVTLLFVCTVMVLCLAPDLIGSVVFLVVPDFFMFRKYHNIFLAYQYFLFFTRSVNSASNFFMYVLLSSKFRATLKEMFLHRR